MIAYCIGNGPSRKNFDLSKLKNGYTYGCNALYRDFIPNFLFCIDGEMAEEWNNAGVQNKCKVFCPKNDAIKYTGFNTIPNYKKSNLGGHQAIMTAYYHGCRKIYLIGFDFAEFGENKLNNIYQGSQNYGVRITKEEFIKSIEWFKNFIEEKTDAEFYVVNNNPIDKVKKIHVKNFNIMTYKEFENGL
tara:strand:- start:193 stop:756 length:564 start_codon:yes stop_codon:yes gene_type:complete